MKLRLIPKYSLGKKFKPTFASFQQLNFPIVNNYSIDPIKIEDDFIQPYRQQSSQQPIITIENIPSLYGTPQEEPIKEEKKTEKKSEKKTESKKETPQSSEGSSLAAKIVATAVQFDGGKYVSGGTKPEQGGFDCSGLISYAYRSNGVDIPRTTYGMFKMGSEVSLKDVKPGDVICTPGSGYTKKHVKMVSKIVDGQIYVIEASGRKVGIVERPLTKTNNIITIRRVLT